MIKICNAKGPVTFNIITHITVFRMKGGIHKLLKTHDGMGLGIKLGIWAMYKYIYLELWRLLNGWKYGQMLITTPSIHHVVSQLLILSEPQSMCERKEHLSCSDVESKILWLWFWHQIHNTVKLLKTKQEKLFQANIVSSLVIEWSTFLCIYSYLKLQYVTVRNLFICCSIFTYGDFKPWKAGRWVVEEEIWVK